MTIQPTIDCQKLCSLEYKSSDNCIYSEQNGFFYKIQTNKNEDPLGIEAIITDILSTKAPILFSKYVAHFTCDANCNVKVQDEDKTMNIRDKIVLVTKTIPGIQGLFDYITNPSCKICVFLEQLNAFIGSYIKIAESLGFIHQDLHMDNIVCSISDTNETIIKIIDFGRSYINVSKMIEKNDEINKLKFSIEHNITSEHGYMCDVATLAINVITCSIRPCMILANDINKYIYKRNGVLKVNSNWIIKFSNDPSSQFYFFDLGIIFFTIICLAWVNHNSNNSVMEYIKIEDSFVNIYISNMRNNGNPIILSNGVIRTRTYNQISDKVIPVFLDIYKKTTSEQGGGHLQDFFANIKNRYYKITPIKLCPDNLEEVKEFDNIEDIKLLLTQESGFILRETTNATGGNYPQIRKYRSRKIYIEKQTGRKYVIIKRHKWYLDQNRGKYRYIDITKKSLYILQSSMYKDV